MAIPEKHRRRIYEFFLPNLGEEAASAMMSQFPARDVEEAVTKEHLTSELALMRMELHEEVAAVRTELRTEMGELRTELRAEMGELRTELRTGFAQVRTEMAGLRTEIGDEMRHQLQWIVGMQVAILAVVVTLVVAFA